MPNVGKHTRDERYAVAQLKELRTIRKALGIPGPGTRAEKALKPGWLILLLKGGGVCPQ